MGTAGYAVVPDYTAKATPMIDVSVVTTNHAAAVSRSASVGGRSFPRRVRWKTWVPFLSMLSGAVMLPMPEGSTGRLSSACPVSVAT